MGPGEPIQIRVERGVCPSCADPGRKLLFTDVNRREGLPVEGSYWTCSSCSTHYLDPIPDEPALARLHESIAPAAAAEAPAIIARRGAARLVLRRLLGRPFPESLVPPRPGARVLDLGCGRGIKLLEYAAAGWRVCGVDVSASSLEYARRILPGGEFHHGELKSLDLAPGSFDQIRLDNVLEHIPNPLELLKSLDRLLAPEGALMIYVPNGQALTLSLLGRFSAMAWIPFHLTLFSPKGLMTLLERAGYGQAEVRNHHPLESYGWSLKQALMKPGEWEQRKRHLELGGRALFPVGLLAAAVGKGEELAAKAGRFGQG